MSNTIEQAKTGRAKCRKCREKIEKGALRFGHAVEGDYGESLQWYHLACAAEKVPIDLEKSLAEYGAEIPDRAALEESIAKNRGKQKPSRLPYAELAPSGRSACLVCGEKIPKDEPRVAVEREIDAGGFTRMGAGYLHPACVPDLEDAPDDLAEDLRENSISLSPEQLESVLGQIG